jgi:hypothetical protein
MPDDLKYPYSYRAYSLNILSQIPVSGFETVPATDADVFIHLGEVPESLPDAVNRGVLFQSSETGFLLLVERVARYLVLNGREITVQLLGNASPGEVSAFISGTAFGALLLQRRMLPIHASTVLFKNRCLVFAGISGSGKSTLAASIVNAGGMLIADDISVIDFSGERPAVCPAFPMIKIWEDSLKHLGISHEGLEPVRGELRKFYLPVSRFSRTFTPIYRIYVIASHNREDLDVKDLQGVEKFRVLKKHTYLFRGIPKTGLEQNHFMLANRIANLVPVTMLIRPNGEFNTGKLIRYLTETVTMG